MSRSGSQLIKPINASERLKKNIHKNIKMYGIFVRCFRGNINILLTKIYKESPDYFYIFVKGTQFVLQLFKSEENNLLIEFVL